MLPDCRHIGPDYAYRIQKIISPSDIRIVCSNILSEHLCGSASRARELRTIGRACGVDVTDLHTFFHLYCVSKNWKYATGYRFSSIRKYQEWDKRHFLNAVVILGDNLSNENLLAYQMKCSCCSMFVVFEAFTNSCRSFLPQKKHFELKEKIEPF